MNYEIQRNITNKDLCCIFEDKNLSKKEREKELCKVVDSGILESREYSNKEIADMLDMTEVGVFYIVKNALRKLNRLADPSELTIEFASPEIQNM
jgi:DNA-directed RNA polymerase specialized sigma subunit